MYSLFMLWLYHLTLKQLEKHECIFSTVAADALVLKHQAISIHSVDKYSLYWSSSILKKYINSLVQERCNSIANTLELHLSGTNPSIYINGLV